MTFVVLGEHTHAHTCARLYLYLCAISISIAISRSMGLARPRNFSLAAPVGARPQTPAPPPPPPQLASEALRRRRRRRSADSSAPPSDSINHSDSSVSGRRADAPSAGPFARQSVRPSVGLCVCVSVRVCDSTQTELSGSDPIRVGSRETRLGPVLTQVARARAHTSGLIYAHNYAPRAT